MRYLIKVSYDGSKYYGFQRLNNNNSIQGELEKALSIINKNKVVVKGSGRTDRGVHAICQCCHFDLDVNVPPERLVNAINSLLDRYIRVIDCKIVSDDFHARFMVKEKEYKYIVNMGKYDPIMDDYIYNYCYNLDITEMINCSKYLIGKHNYQSFVSGYRDNYNSEIYSISFDKKGDYLYITFVGKSFYRYMIRNMVGALIMVGRGKMSFLEFKKMIDEPNDKYSYMTVPANGLYLERVDY